MFKTLKYKNPYKKEMKIGRAAIDKNEKKLI